MDNRQIGAGIVITVAGVCMQMPVIAILGITVFVAALLTEKRSLSARQLTDGPYEVILMGTGKANDEAVRVIREVLGIEREEAARLLSSAPALIKSGVSWEDAMYLRDALGDAGCSVSVATPDSVMQFPDVWDNRRGPLVASWPSEGSPTPEWPAGPYQVVLASSTADTVTMVTVVQDACGCGLKRARQIVSLQPSLVARSVSKDVALTLKSKLEVAGAVVEISRLIDQSEDETQDTPPNDRIRRRKTAPLTGARPAGA